MTNLRSALDKYLSMRMGLGYKYEHQRPVGSLTSLLSWRSAKARSSRRGWQ